MNGRHELLLVSTYSSQHTGSPAVATAIDGRSSSSASCQAQLIDSLTIQRLELPLRNHGIPNTTKGVKKKKKKKSCKSNCPLPLPYFCPVPFSLPLPHATRHPGIDSDSSKHISLSQQAATQRPHRQPIGHLTRLGLSRRAARGSGRELHWTFVFCGANSHSRVRLPLCRERAGV